MINDDTVLHIIGVPPGIIPAINRHNIDNRKNKINITQVCIDALRAAMKKQGVKA